MEPELRTIAAEQTVLTDKDFRDFYLKSTIERLIVSVEPDGRYIFAEVNHAASSYFAIPRENMVGRAPFEVFDRPAAEHMEQAWVTCVRTRKSMTYNALPRFQGGVRMHVFILNPVLDAAGNVRFIDMMTRPEMTDGAQLQRERDDALMLMTSIFDASGLGILVTDRHGRVVRVNDAFIADFGWTRDDLLGEEFTAMIPTPGRSISRKLHRAFIERGRHGTRELQLLRKDGGVADVMATTALLELSQGRRFMVSTVRDMTERRNMVRKLQRAKEEADVANRAKSSFLANMSHELRTPLNAIIGFTELMRSRTFGTVANVKYEEYLGDIHFSARHLLEIINDVLDMSKIEAGKVELIESEMPVPELVDSVLRIMADRAHAAAVTLEFEAPEALPHIRADQRLLRQILINLLSNAIKFSFLGKKVVIRARSVEGGGLRILVEDEGCGIPAAKISHVLEPFGQAYDARMYAGQGTGLGLPLAKAMIELHGGVLAIESAEGVGTKVWIDLPAERILPVP
jgi:two-component system cell cycle sensor histidine kinase PleC